MTTEPQRSLQDFLRIGQDGHALLFLGAGYSASSLNFSSQRLGVGEPLLQELSEALDYPYTDLQIAADEYVERFGAVGPALNSDHPPLKPLLEQRFRVMCPHEDALEILRYPWWRIYTTNYDDLAERALTHLGRPYCTANNLDPPDSVETTLGERTLIVHLHGRVESWDDGNFEGSCVLGRESYLRITGDTPWVRRLRDDMSMASAVVFIGFSNSDFHLAQSLQNLTANRAKTFFVNAEGDVDDRELLARQGRVGTSLALGLHGLADITKRSAVGHDPSTLKNLHNFVERANEPPAAERAGVQTQESFIVFGRTSPEHLVRDIQDGTDSYRARRRWPSEVTEFIEQPSSVAMVTGGICAGKSMVLEEVVARQIIGGRAVFSLEARFVDVAEEAIMIMDARPDGTIVIDDVYQLEQATVKRVLKAASERGYRLVLSARTVAFDAADDPREALDRQMHYRSFDIDLLTRDEVLSLGNCVDRLGIVSEGDWRKQPRLPNVLLEVFNSRSVQQRFQTELDKVRARNVREIEGLITAFYLAHIGQPLHETVLTRLLGTDAVSLLAAAGQENPFISYVPSLNRFQVLPSVNARQALLKIVADPELVTSAVINALDRLDDEDRKREPFKRVSRELMRFSNLQQVIDVAAVRDRFFDRLSEKSYCRRQVHFWLQWCMAMRDVGNFSRAEKYIKKAYELAEDIRRRTGGYSTHYLDDQWAGLILDRTQASDSPASRLRTYNDAMSRISSIAGSQEQSRHVYDTIMKSLLPFLERVHLDVPPEHRPLYLNGVSSLSQLVRRTAQQESRAFLKRRMTEAVKALGGIKAILRQPD